MRRAGQAFGGHRRLARARRRRPVARAALEKVRRVTGDRVVHLAFLARVLNNIARHHRPPASPSVLSVVYS